LCSKGKKRRVSVGYGGEPNTRAAGILFELKKKKKRNQS